MRKSLALAALAAAAASLIPASSASAYCVTIEPLPGCYNPCTIADNAYRTADRTAGDKLPNLGLVCPQ